MFRASFILRALFAGLAFLSVLGRANISRGDDVFALVGQGNGNLDNLDITTGISVPISNIGNEFNGLAYNANESVLYGVTSPAILSPSTLVTVNPTTGAVTPIGANGASLTTVTNLSNGNLYGVDANDSLYQINPSTGAATLIGPTGLPAISASTQFSNSLASDGTLLLYTLAMGDSDSSLYTLNPSTGAATLIGDTGVTGIDGSAFAGPTFASGNLYAFLNTGETDSINLTTGVATPLNFNGLTDIFGGVGIVTAAVPEPGTYSIIAVLGVILLGSRRQIARPRRSEN